MVDRDQVYRLVQTKGPLIPSDITRELQADTMIVGAFLSELVSSRLIRISNAKIGGSPLYFVDTQKPRLEKLYPYLNEKDRRAYDELKKFEVLLDEPQTPLMRTALRAIPDFAVPFKVTYKGHQHLFWKWFLSSDDIVKQKVKSILDEMYLVEQPVETKKETPEEKAESIPQPEQPPKEVEESSKEKTEVTSQPKSIPEPEKKDQQTTLAKDNISEKNISAEDDFANQIVGYLNSMKIQALSLDVIKKNRECDLLVKVPSPVGELIYFAKARNKKKSNEGDVAQAFVDGQLKGYPVLYISPGEVPKKVHELIETKYKNLKILTI